MGAITRTAANNFTTNGVILPGGINDASVASITELENTATDGALTLISEQTASGSSTISFTSGIDSTYPIYKFEFINIHPSQDNPSFQVNFRDGGSLYDAVKTSTYFRTSHRENDTESVAPGLATGNSLGQDTGAQTISGGVGADNDENGSGYLFLFNPSNTTFVKHYIANVQVVSGSPQSEQSFTSGYINTATAIDGVQFSMSGGNIDSGTIKLYGIEDS